MRPLQRIVLHAARPPASNHPTADGVRGAEQMLALLGSARPEDVAICLISGGGSALLPAPFGVSLEDKQAVTKLLHACGATIHEMNAVRKHLSRVKGGRFAEAFRGKALFSLIVSDVVGDPLDVIASGPTAADPSTFADALAVLDRYGLTGRSSRRGRSSTSNAGRPGRCRRRSRSCRRTSTTSSSGTTPGPRAATAKAEALGYRVLNLARSSRARRGRSPRPSPASCASIRRDGLPVAPPACVLIGGETTVTLGPDAGKGGRNQEFVLAVLDKLGEDGMRGVAVLSGGTDGEDGPTDAAGAVGRRRHLGGPASAGLDVTRSPRPARRLSALRRRRRADPHRADADERDGRAGGSRSRRCGTFFISRPNRCKKCVLRCKSPPASRSVY